MEHTGRLLDFLHGLAFTDLPGDVVEKAKLCLLDYLGAALAGCREPPAKAALKAIMACGMGGEATLIGSSERAAAPAAALFNGVSGHVLELDDGNRYAMGHPGVCIFPALLAVGERSRLSGRSVILAAVCGYEVFSRVGRAINPGHFERGYHTTGTVGAIAAAVACSKAQGASRSEIGACLGLGASSAAGLMAFLADGSMSKQYHPGHAAMTGVLACFLAKEGFTAPESVLEGRHGFFGAASDRVDTTYLSDGLGERFFIMDTYVKIHASCRHTHAPVDALLAVMSRYDVRAEDIDSITAGVYRAALSFCGRDIETPLSGKMSIPYALAVAAVAGAAGPAQFDQPCLGDLRVKSLMNRINVVFDQEVEAMLPERRGARLTVVARGKSYQEVVNWPKGEPENPVTRADVEAKFQSLATPVIGPSKTRAVLEEIMLLESRDSLERLLEFLRA